MSRQEQQQQVSDVVPSSSSWSGGSNRIAALNLEGTPLPNITDSPDHKQFDHHDEDSLRNRGRASSYHMQALDSLSP